MTKQTLADEVLQNARESVFSNELDALKKGEMSIKDLLNYDFSQEDVEFMKEKLKRVSICKDSYTWGIDCIDEKITTPKKGKVIIMVSDENQGKSTFSYFLARKNYEKYNHNVVYFNLEQTKEEVINDMAIQYCGATKLEVRDNKHLEMRLYNKKVKELQEQKNIVFIGRKAENVTTMAEIKERIEDMPIDYLLLDNLTCISGVGANRNEEMKNIILELISLAQKRNIPILLIHHYRKKNGKTIGIYRDIHEMEGSGTLKNLAPIIIQVARNPEPETKEEEAEFYIREGKLRGGARKESVCVKHDKGDFFKIKDTESSQFNN